MNLLPIVRTVADLRVRVGGWKAGGLSVALVPTMGALHDGHLSLIRRAREMADRVVASVFVNPTQFAAHEDLGRYPRDEAGDAAKLASVGCDLLYAPTVGEMYPPGFATSAAVTGPAEGLCGTFRPQMFGGVALVVTKLFNQVKPDVAVFGEKDYQQLQVIRRFTLDLDLPVRIEGVSTGREADGLAMSSRNAYLTPEQRVQAPALYRILMAAGEAIAGGAAVAGVLEQAHANLLAAGFASVDYIELRDAETLVPVDNLARPARLLAAAWMGKARLIDNIAVVG